jgi:hypothetical protein
MIEDLLNPYRPEVTERPRAAPTEAARSDDD